MKYYASIVTAIITIFLAAAGCGHGADRFPPSLTVENKSRVVIWFSYVKMNGKTIPFGGVGATFFATAGFSVKEVADVRGAIFGLRISTAGEAASSPWTERIYELVDPVFPEASVMKKVKDIRFVYFDDGSAKINFLGDHRIVLGEIQMKLKETVSSEAAGKDEKDIKEAGK